MCAKNIEKYGSHSTKICLSHRPVHSATYLLTSPSVADATHSAPRAHSSGGASERVCEIEKGRRKSSPSHTQITQSISASQDSPQ